MYFWGSLLKVGGAPAPLAPTFRRHCYSVSRIKNTVPTAPGIRSSARTVLLGLGTVLLQLEVVLLGLALGLGSDSALVTFTFSYFFLHPVQ